jgi:actin-related protein
LTSWETEKAIWDTILFDGEKMVSLIWMQANDRLILRRRHCWLRNLFLTFLFYRHRMIKWCLKSMNFILIAESLVFSDFNPTNLAPSLVPWHPNIRGTLNMSECVLVVDSGFSFTHVIPVVNGKVIWSAVKRWILQGRLNL